VFFFLFLFPCPECDTSPLPRGTTTKDTGKAPFLMSLIDSHKSFSKKPIRSIEVLEDLKLMLSITGEHYPLLSE